TGACSATTAPTNPRPGCLTQAPFWSYAQVRRPMRQEVLDKAREDPRGTPARILDAAEDVFAAEGYAGASMRDIARRAEVPFGALHYHWGSKKQLWEAVFTR